TLAAVLVVLIAIAAFIAFAPASLVDSVLSERTRGGLRMADASGTLLHGRGVVSDQRGVLRVPVAWRVSLAQLFRGNLGIALEPEDDARRPRGIVARRDGGWVVTGLDLRLSAASLGAVLPALAPKLGGELAISAPAFRYQDRLGEGRIDVVWSSASVALPA